MESTAIWSISKAVWDAAEQTCEQQGGHLASVTSNATNQYILSGLAQRGMTEELWIGGTDSKEEGSWEWTDGSAWDFTYWASREPKHTTALNCLQYYSSSSQTPSISTLCQNSNGTMLTARHKSGFCAAKSSVQVG